MDKSTFYIGVFIFAVIYLIATLVYLMFRQYLRFRERELEVGQVRLDDFRAHLERQLTELNSRFSASEERWRQLNHLVVAGQTEDQNLTQPTRVPSESAFLFSHGIEPKSIGLRRELIFVLTPYHEDFLDEYETVSRVGRDLGFSVSRGDERVPSGQIFPALLRLIVQARVIVANISGRNPNVFYELGIAHAIDKLVILIAQSKSDVPFDVAAKRIIFYDNNEQLQRELERMLARILAHEDT
jgi:hypothetical protein